MYQRRRVIMAAGCLLLAGMQGSTLAVAAPKQRCVTLESGQVLCYVVKDATPARVVPAGRQGGSAPSPAPVYAPWARVAAVPGAPGAGGAVVTPAQLGARAAASLRLPEPVARRSPEDVLPDGRSTTWVRLQTWFFVPAQQWQPVTVTATAGGLSATATARPTALTFDPGDGSAPVSCAGPGRAWAYGVDKNFDVAPGGCSYAYPRSSFGFAGGMVTATYAIRWEITWTATGGPGGVLPDVTTTSQSRFAVAEAQAVTQ